MQEHLEPDPSYVPLPWWEAALDTLWFPFALLWVAWPFLPMKLRRLRLYFWALPLLIAGAGVLAYPTRGDATEISTPHLAGLAMLLAAGCYVAWVWMVGD
jgi:hypothetical protein